VTRGEVTTILDAMEMILGLVSLDIRRTPDPGNAADLAARLESVLAELQRRRGVQRPVLHVVE
jgi:hypothetical protein